MILVAMLLAAQAMPAPTSTDDIVVSGRRMEQMKRLRMTTKIDRSTGLTRCVFKRRSGDPALDATVCNAVLGCTPKMTSVEQMRVCLAPTMNVLVAKDVPWQAEAARDNR